MSLFRFSTRISSILNSSLGKNVLKQKNNIMSVFCRTLQIESINNEEIKHSTRQYEELKIEKYQKLFRDDDSVKANIKNILTTYEHQKYKTCEVPLTITEKDMKDLLRVYSNEKELLRCIKFLYIRECKKFSSKKKKHNKKIVIAEKKREKYGEEVDFLWQHGIWNHDRSELLYGLWHNSILNRITKHSISHYRHNHLQRSSAIFGQKLIIDLDYDEYMEIYEAKLLASQLGILFYDNRINRDYPEELPFDIHFTNCSKAFNTMESLSKHIKKMDELSTLFHPESYLNLPNLFPKHKLIYLSPHANNSLKEYNHDHIYILGGYNDRTSHEHVSHIKAQKENIPTFRLPLDEHVLWRQGNKNLCLNQVAAILHCVKNNNNWSEAIHRYAPARKIKSSEEVALHDQIAIKNIQRRMKGIEKSYKFKDF